MFNHILIPLDGSPLAECVLTRAIELARAFGAQVTLLRVLDEPAAVSCLQPIDPLEWDMCKAEVRSYLEGLEDRFREADIRSGIAILEGHPAQRIMEFVRTSDVDLILLSSHGRSGLNGWNCGSILHKILLRSPVSAMIVRAYQAENPESAETGCRRIMIPLDGSQRAECALSPAAALARLYNSRLLFAHVVCRPEIPRRTPLAQADAELANRIVERNQQEAMKYLEHLRSMLSLDIQCRVLVSHEAAIRLHELIDEENVDLIVLSAHGYSGMARWPYGSIATSFILYGATPLLIVQDLLPHEFRLTQAEVASRERKGH